MIAINNESLAKKQVTIKNICMQYHSISS